MNKKDAIGLRIVDIKQSWFDGTCGRRYVIDAIYLDNGTRILFATCEGEGEYGIEAFTVKDDSRKG